METTLLSDLTGDLSGLASKQGAAGVNPYKYFSDYLHC